MTVPADFSDALEAYLDLAVPDRAKNETRRRVRSALSDMYLIECGSDQARMLEAVTDDLDEIQIKVDLAKNLLEE